MHIRIYLIPADGPSKRLPPTQKKGIPGCQGKTPVAQTHFALELPLSQGNHRIDVQKITIQANSG
jgi:hypothetical protein